MTPEALLAVVVLAWMALLAGLWRLSASMDRIERFLARSEFLASPLRGGRRG